MVPYSTLTKHGNELSQLPIMVGQPALYTLPMSQFPSTSSEESTAVEFDEHQYHTITFSNPEHQSPEAPRRSLRSVVQDKALSVPSRAFVNHSSRAGDRMRAHRSDGQLNTTTTRVQKRSSRRQKEKVTIWLERPIALELKRLAEGSKLSISSTGAALLAQAIRLSLHEQQQALLQPAVQLAVRQELKTLGNRLAALLVAVKLDTGIIRQVEVNVLARLTNSRQMDEETLNDIRDRSGQRARQEIRGKTPQLRSLIEEEMASWLTEEDQ
jgi:hypothetical protein